MDLNRLSRISDSAGSSGKLTDLTTSEFDALKLKVFKANKALMDDFF